MVGDVEKQLSGGGSGIRTPEGLAPLLVFKTSAFNRSANPPYRKARDAPVSGRATANSPDRLKFHPGAVNMFDLKIRFSDGREKGRLQSSLFVLKPLRILGTCGKKGVFSKSEFQWQRNRRVILFSPWSAFS